MTAVIDVPVGYVVDVVGPQGPHSVGIVQELPQTVVAGHFLQLPPVLPGIFPLSVTQGIAQVIPGDLRAADACQRVAPLGIAAGIADSIQRGAQGPGGVGVLRFPVEIPGKIIGESPALARDGVVLPDQLIVAVVGIGDCNMIPLAPALPKRSAGGLVFMRTNVMLRCSGRITAYGHNSSQREVFPQWDHWSDPLYESSHCLFSYQGFIICTVIVILRYKCSLTRSQSFAFYKI